MEKWIIQGNNSKEIKLALAVSRPAGNASIGGQSLIVDDLIIKLLFT